MNLFKPIILFLGISSFIFLFTILLALASFGSFAAQVSILVLTILGCSAAITYSLFK